MERITPGEPKKFFFGGDPNRTKISPKNFPGGKGLEDQTFYTYRLEYQEFFNQEVYVCDGESL